jgi:hypothetical protein
MFQKQYTGYGELTAPIFTALRKWTVVCDSEPYRSTRGSQKRTAPSPSLPSPKEARRGWPS